MNTARIYVFAICIWLVTLAVVGCGEDKPSDSGGNKAPCAAFTVSPELGGTQTVFEFDASSCSDAEDASALLEVRWDWENDGWDTGWSATKTVTHQYETQGTKTVKLEVKDTGGMTDDTTRTVAVSGVNVPPMAVALAGTFEIGDGEAHCGTDQYQVTLTRGFYLGKHEVTTREYRDALQWAYDHDPKLVKCLGGAVEDAVDGSTVMLVMLGTSYSRIYYSASEDSFTVVSGYDDHPVTQVSWYGAVAYCDWISLQAGLTRAYDHSTWQCNGGDPYTAAGYRLPTAAEWEYATQYGGKRVYPWGDEAPDCSRANYDCGPGAVGQTSPVGSRPGWTVVDEDSIYDMAGNVWEWCNDWSDCLPGDPIDPKGPSTGSHRMLRGASWADTAGTLACAGRYPSPPSRMNSFYGFRCARSR